ncbi:hypothetical protein U2I54_27480 [Bacillus pseudomycoides]|uniref:Uncharacterized protein n=1 Tax=Bacillus bingmayongensis TaxID=1150157 RepID=A0ABU5K4G0_9BACI|nr:hypothetical protein [Bacillus pseudomycoides]
MLYRKVDYNPSFKVQEKYEREEPLRIISEKAKTNDDLKELVEYQFNKYLNELIEKFKQPIIDEAMMNYTISKNLTFKAEREKDTE